MHQILNWWRCKNCGNVGITTMWETQFPLWFVTRLFAYLLTVLRPAEVFFTYGDVTITGEGLQNLGYARRSEPSSRDGSLSCHICSDTGPLSFWFYTKDRQFQWPLSTNKGMWRTHSNPDLHGSPFSRLLLHTKVCGGAILTRIRTGSRLRFVLFVCFALFATLNIFSVIWWRSVSMDGIQCIWGETTNLPQVNWQTFSHIQISRAGFEPILTGGERSRGKRPMPSPRRPIQIT
jgi:hypothetical protein